MKKNLILILIIVLLVGVFAYLKFNKSKTNFEYSEFSIQDTDEIGSILMKDRNNQVCRIVKRDKKWWVDDSIEAEHDKILILLSTIQKIQVENPVSDSLRPLAIADLRQTGVYVELKDEDGDELKTFYIGSSLGNGNYGILSEDGVVASQPFVLRMPGVQSADIRRRFTTNPNAWYSTEVFSTAIDKLKEIKMEFIEKSDFSFRLVKDEDLIKIDPLLDSLKINKSLNQDRVVQYLLEFEKKHMEARINSDTVVQFIKTLKPSYIITVTDIFDKSKSIILYRIPTSFMPEYTDLGTLDATGKSMPFNIEKYWGYIPSTKTYALVQHYTFGPILQPYSYFFEK